MGKGGGLKNRKGVGQVKFTSTKMGGGGVGRKTFSYAKVGWMRGEQKVSG